MMLAEGFYTSPTCSCININSARGSAVLETYLVLRVGTRMYVMVVMAGLA